MFRPLTALLLGLLSLTPPAPGLADSNDASYIVGSSAPLVSTSAEVEDLGILADELGIGFAEAEARYAGQELFAAVVDQARRDDAQHFSSARWTPEESVSAAISFVGKPSDEVVAALAGLPFEVRVSEAGAMTEFDFESVHVAVQESVASLVGVAEVQSWGDPASGTLTVSYVIQDYADNSFSADVEGVARRAAEGLVALEFVDDTAGKTVLTAIVGGNPLLNCTAGFTVTSGASTGVSTAGHCDDGVPQTFYGGSYATFGAVAAPANGDIQWHKFVGAAAVTNKIRYTSAGGLRTVTSATNPVAGSAICYWGKSSGNHCGTVGTANMCAGSYCRLFSSNPSTLIAGDSGGPWYWGNAGKGLSEGYQTNMLGLRLYDLATQVGAHSYLGLAVKITP